MRDRAVWGPAKVQMPAPAIHHRRRKIASTFFTLIPDLGDLTCRGDDGTGGERARQDRPHLGEGRALAVEDDEAAAA